MFERKEFDIRNYVGLINKAEGQAALAMQGVGVSCGRRPYHGSHIKRPELPRDSKRGCFYF